MQKYLFLFGLILFFSGCGGKTTDELLAEVGALLEISPDSANLLLDNIAEPGLMREYQEARYNHIRLTFILNRTGQWTVADSLNNWLKDFYRKENDTVRFQKSVFISGWISLVQHNPDKAIEQFIEAKKIAETTRQKHEIYRSDYYISRGFLDKEEYERALFYAKDLLTDIEDECVELITNRYHYIAFIYKEANHVDSAMVYYKKALELAINNDMMRLVSHMFNEISEMQLSNEDYKEALYYSDLSIKHRGSRKDVSFFNLTKARVFLATNQTDSAKFYLKRAIESSDDNFVSIIAYRYLADLYRDIGDYKQAFYRQLDYKEFFERRSSELATEQLTQKYQEEKLKNENNELKLAKREQENLFLTVALILLIVITILLFYLFSEHKKKKTKEHILKEEALKVQSRIVENENELLRRENELMILREKSAVLRESLFRKMSVASKIPSLKTSDDETETVSSGKIHLEEPDWNELIHTVDALFGGFASRLTNEYPGLSKEDIGFCCLIKINVSMQDLADIYCISKAGITKRKTRMKKDKFGIHNEGLSLDDFLASF